MGSIKVKVNSIALEPGVAYLTLGTIEQIQLLLPDLEVTYLYEPTDLEIRHQAKGDPIKMMMGESEVIIVIPTRSKDKKKRKVFNDNALPLDSHFKISKHIYLFIICVDVSGEVIDKTATKKMVGGVYEILDLQACDWSEYKVPEDERFPKSYLSRQGKDIKDYDYEYQKNKSLILSLTTLKGVREWGNFNKSQTYKYFLIENFKNVPILTMTGALRLEPYLEPFIKKFKSVGSQTALLTFAYWVYCSSNYWNDYYNKGLVFTPNKNGGGYFHLFLSEKAKLKWYQMLTCTTF